MVLLNLKIMKKSILVIGISFLSSVSFSQKNTNISDTIPTIETKKNNRTDLEVVGDETAKYLSTRSKQEKEYFKNIFFHKRGGFTVPKEPIAYPFKD